jgi:hypothetical protein
MRRLIIEEPVSRPAKWSPTLAWFALVVTVFAVLLIRFNRIDYQAGFIALGAGIAIALLAVAMSFLGFVRIWQEGRQGLGSAIRGLFLAALVLAYPGFMALKAATLPPIADISTDTDDPPAFSRSRAALQARDGRVPPDILGRLEAVDRSRLLKMPSDITVRVRPRVDGTRIDIRSASRFGSHDLGANAGYIRDFLEEASNLAVAVR